ncbi:MAG: redoxin domain-containing protein [Gemmatimonas sp.]
MLITAVLAAISIGAVAATGSANVASTNVASTKSGGGGSDSTARRGVGTGTRSSPKTPVAKTLAPKSSSATLPAAAHYVAFGYRPGERVPDTRFTDISGKPGVLSAIAGTRGAVVVVRDAECPVSQRYSPRLAELEKSYGAKGFNFVYIDATPHSGKESRDDAAKYGLTGRVVLDSAKRLLGALRATSSAEAFVIDAAGTLRYRGAVDDQYGITFHKDAATTHWLRDALDRVIANKDVSTPSTEASGCMFEVDLDAPGAARPVTYHNRVSRIIQQKCESCHRVDGLAPMPLQNYRQVFERRAVVSFMTSSRRMPPWSANPKVGEWANDPSLSKQELADLLSWVKVGAPQGIVGEAPLKRAYTPGWEMGKPDAIVQIPDTFRIPAQGVVQYKYSYAKTNFDSDKWIAAMEIHPTAPKVVHHVLVFLEEPGRKAPNDPTRKPGEPAPNGGVDGFFAATAPGSPAAVFPLGAAKKLPKGAWLKFQIHYQPNGTEQVDQTRIGLMFADDSTMVSGKFAEVQSKSAFNTRFAIPPGDGNYQVNASTTFRTSGTLLSLFPHTHLRGKAWKIELMNADSTKTLLLDVPRYDFNWQTFYSFKTPVRVQPGQRLIATAWYDNSKANPFNPDPTATVRFGEQTFEEMMIGYFDWIPDAPSAAPAPRADTAKKGGTKP